MISELIGDFLVSVEAVITDDAMHDRRRWLAALPCTLIAIGAAPVTAGEPDDADAGAYILQAEMALQRHDYLVAAQEYRKAAERSDDSDVARRATRSAMAYGFNREALAAAKRWHKLDARNDEARVFLAQLSFRTGDVRAARRHFSYLVERGGEPPGDTLLTLVRYLSDEGDPGKADKLMRSLARPYPDSASAHRAVATMALKAGETAYALGRVSKAIELDADSLNSKLLYGRILLADGQPEKAIDYTARIIGDDPAPSPDARMELAILYMMVNRPDDALSQVNQVLLEHTGRMDALRLMAIINFH
ncbi:MAG: tetratricopeptide repeat protein, partial [Proteobacteria bacterium]|nr:tetratricopeptide repeat protein [Pseudomonadota bacterium]